MTTYELDRAIASEADDDGRRHLVLTAEWNTPNGSANGGYVLAVLGRAVLDHAAQAAPDHPDLLTIAINYLKPPLPGPVHVEVSTVRVGRRISVHRAALVQEGVVVADGQFSLHDWDAAGEARHAPHTPPDVPSPGACVDLATAIPAGLVPIADRYEARAPEVPGWLRGEPSGDPTALVWVRPRDGRPIDAVAAAAIVDGFPPVTAEIGHLASATVQLTVYLRSRPSTPWSLLHVSTRHVVDGYHDEDVELWSEDGVLLAQGRQLAILS